MGDKDKGFDWKAVFNEVQEGFRHLPQGLEAEAAARIRAAAIRALLETFLIAEVECPASTEETLTLLEDTFIAVSPKLIRLVKAESLPARAKFRSRLVSWRIFYPKEDVEEITREAFDEDLTKHGMRRPSLIEAICMLARVSKELERYCGYDWRYEEEICAVIAGLDEKLEMTYPDEVCGHVLAFDSVEYLFPGRFYVCVLIEEKKS